jgi:hypothetical protein
MAQVHLTAEARMAWLAFQFLQLPTGKKNYKEAYEIPETT